MDTLYKLMKLHPYSPIRIPEWRWQRAEWHREHPDWPVQAPDDEWVKRAMRFQETEHSPSSADPESVVADPDIAVALTVYRSQGSLLRAELEARLLADDRRAHIAERTAMTESAIVAYEALFFNVSNRLHAKSFIAHFAIGPSIHHGLCPPDLSLLWKLFGYAAGPTVLDALVDVALPMTDQFLAQGIDAYFTEDCRATASLKCAVAGKMIKVDTATAARVLGMYQQLRRLEQRELTPSPTVAEMLMQLTDDPTCLMPLLSEPSVPVNEVIPKPNEPIRASAVVVAA